MINAIAKGSEFQEVLKDGKFQGLSVQQIIPFYLHSKKNPPAFTREDRLIKATSCKK